MEAVFLKLLNMSITAGWIVLAVVLLRLVLKKAPRWISCLLWVLVGIRLVLPFSFESKVSVIPSTETVPQEIVYSQAPSINSGVPFVNSTVNPVISESLAPQVGASANPIQIVIFIASIAWCIGIAGMAIYALVSYLHIRHKVRISAPLRENIYICDGISTPFILGIFKPRIYLPSDLEEKEAEYIIAHEKSHLKRRDHLWKPIGFALLTVYWFNPLLWLGYVLLCRDIELACDERVIKDMGAEDKKAYSTALLDCSIPRRMISACPLAFGEVNVKNRIKNVLNYKKPAFWIIIVAIIACVIAAVCLLTDPKSNDEEIKENSASAADIIIEEETTDSEGISISVKSMDLYSELPYIEIQWTNETDECMIFRDSFTLCYKDGDAWIDSSTKEISYGTTRYALPPHDTVWRKYYLSYHDLTQKEYLFTAEYFPNERPSEIHSASVYFDIEAPIDPMETSDYQASSVIYANSLLSSPDELGMGTGYRVVTNSSGIALYSLNSVNEYDSIGILKFTELTEKNFDCLFSVGWKRSDLSAKTLRQQNKQAFMAGNAENRLHILLFQNDGSVYLMTGYLDNENKKTAFAERVYELTSPALLSYEDVVTGESDIKIFTYKNSIDIIDPNITLYGNGEFQFIWSGLSSYIGWGSYILTSNTLTLPTDDGMYIYVFDVTDEGFRFDAERSSEITKFRYHPDEEAQTPVSDGAVFEGDMAKIMEYAQFEPLQLAKGAISNTSDWKTAGLESAGLKNVEISEPHEISFGNLYVLTHNILTRIYKEMFLALETDDEILLAKIGETVCIQDVYCCDIDGENGDEIVFMTDDGGNGGAGSHTSYVYKVTDSGFKTLFDVNTYITPFNTGFEYELQAPFKMLVRNTITDYSTVVDFSDNKGYIGGVYDEEGNPLGEWHPSHDCFYEFVPSDVDNDGVYEIICTSYTHLYSHADYIGDSECTLKYNKVSGEFEVIDARFIPIGPAFISSTFYPTEEYLNIPVKSEIIDSGEYFTVTDYDNFTYGYEIRDINGNVLLKETDVPKYPWVEMINDSVVRIIIQYGNTIAARKTVYCNIFTGEISDPFVNAWCEYGNNVLYCENGTAYSRIIVQDFFDQKSFYKEIKLEDAHDLAVIYDLTLSEDGMATAKYHKGKDYTDVEVQIDMTK